MSKKIAYLTNLREIPENCLDCDVIGCWLPLKKSRSGITDIVKKEFLTKRHKECPLFEVKEEE